MKSNMLLNSVEKSTLEAEQPIRIKAYFSLAILSIAWIYFFWSTLVSISVGYAEIKDIFFSIAILLAVLYLVYLRRAKIEEAPFTVSQLALFCLFCLTIGY